LHSTFFKVKKSKSLEKKLGTRAICGFAQGTLLVQIIKAFFWFCWQYQSKPNAFQTTADIFSSYWSRTMRMTNLRYYKLKVEYTQTAKQGWAYKTFNLINFNVI
jgi:hypothetical protein